MHTYHDLFDPEMERSVSQSREPSAASASDNDWWEEHLDALKEYDIDYETGNLIDTEYDRQCMSLGY